MPATAAADIGAFVSVPIRLSDGSLHGTLCCASHRAHPELSDRDLDFMHVLARVIAGQIEREQLDRLARELERPRQRLEALAAAIAARDTYTGGHSRGGRRASPSASAASSAPTTSGSRRSGSSPSSTTPASLPSRT